MATSQDLPMDSSQKMDVFMSQESKDLNTVNVTLSQDSGIASQNLIDTGPFANLDMTPGFDTISMTFSQESSIASQELATAAFQNSNMRNMTEDFRTDNIAPLQSFTVPQEKISTKDICVDCTIDALIKSRSVQKVKRHFFKVPPFNENFKKSRNISDEANETEKLLYTAKHNPRHLLPKNFSEHKNSIEDYLIEMYVENIEKEKKNPPKMTFGPFIKCNYLEELVKSKNLNYLIFSLYPDEYCFSIKIKDETRLFLSSKYDYTKLLDYLDNKEVPHFICELLYEYEILKYVFSRYEVVAKIERFKSKMEKNVPLFSYFVVLKFKNSSSEVFMSYKHKLDHYKNVHLTSESHYLQSKLNDKGSHYSTSDSEDLLNMSEDICLDPNPAISELTEFLQEYRNPFASDIFKSPIIQHRKSHQMKFRNDRENISGTKELSPMMNIFLNVSIKEKYEELVSMLQERDLRIFTDDVSEEEKRKGIQHEIFGFYPLTPCCRKQRILLESFYIEVNLKINASTEKEGSHKQLKRYILKIYFQDRFYYTDLELPDAKYKFVTSKGLCLFRSREELDKYIAKFSEKASNGFKESIVIYRKKAFQKDQTSFFECKEEISSCTQKINEVNHQNTEQKEKVEKKDESSNDKKKIETGKEAEKLCTFEDIIDAAVPVSPASCHGSDENETISDLNGKEAERSCSVADVIKRVVSVSPVSCHENDDSETISNFNGKGAEKIFTVPDMVEHAEPVSPASCHGDEEEMEPTYSDVYDELLTIEEDNKVMGPTSDVSDELLAVEEDNRMTGPTFSDVSDELLAVEEDNRVTEPTNSDVSDELLAVEEDNRMTGPTFSDVSDELLAVEEDSDETEDVFKQDDTMKSESENEETISDSNEKEEKICTVADIIKRAVSISPVSCEGNGISKSNKRKKGDEMKDDPESTHNYFRDFVNPGFQQQASETRAVIMEQSMQTDRQQQIASSSQNFRSIFAGESSSKSVQDTIKSTHEIPKWLQHGERRFENISSGARERYDMTETKNTFKNNKRKRIDEEMKDDPENTHNNHRDYVKPEFQQQASETRSAFTGVAPSKSDQETLKNTHEIPKWLYDPLPYEIYGNVDEFLSLTLDFLNL